MRYREQQVLELATGVLTPEMVANKLGIPKNHAWRIIDNLTDLGYLNDKGEIIHQVGSDIHKWDIPKGTKSFKEKKVKPFMYVRAS